MSTSNVIDGDPIADTISTVDTASSITVATSDGPNFPLLQLPLELQKMIWSYVIAACDATIGPAEFSARGLRIQRVKSTDDEQGTYPPHPLCYVCKTISNEFRQQIYRTALFKANPIIYYIQPKAFPPITRLSLPIDLAASILEAVFPNVRDSSKQPKKHMVLSNAPGLKYLELVWHTDFPLPSPRGLLLRSIRRMLIRLRFFRKSFEVETRFFAHHSPGGRVACSGTITDTSMTFEYGNGFTKSSDFEYILAQLMCTGGSRQEQASLDHMVSYLNCLEYQSPMRLGEQIDPASYFKIHNFKLVHHFDE